jgi:hypothetical protein
MNTKVTDARCETMKMNIKYKTMEATITSKTTEKRQVDDKTKSKSMKMET